MRRRFRRGEDKRAFLDADRADVFANGFHAGFRAAGLHERIAASARNRQGGPVGALKFGGGRRDVRRKDVGGVERLPGSGGKRRRHAAAHDDAAFLQREIACKWHHAAARADHEIARASLGNRAFAGKRERSGSHPIPGRGRRHRFGRDADAAHVGIKVSQAGRGVGQCPLCHEVALDLCEFRFGQFVREENRLAEIVAADGVAVVALAEEVVENLEPVPQGSGKQLDALARRNGKCVDHLAVQREAGGLDIAVVGVGAQEVATGKGVECRELAVRPGVHAESVV